MPCQALLDTGDAAVSKTGQEEGQGDSRCIMQGSVAERAEVEANTCLAFRPQLKEFLPTSLARSAPQPTLSTDTSKLAFVCMAPGCPAVSLNRPHLVLHIFMFPASSKAMPTVRV